MPTPKRHDSIAAILAGTGIVVVGLCVAWTWWLGWPPPDLQRASNWGESFGGLNTLFSGFAFAGVIVTLYLQRRELELQRQELQLTREELKRTADAQAASQKELARAADAQHASQEALLKQSQLLHCSILANLRSALAQAYAGLALAHFHASGRSGDENVQSDIKSLDEQIQSLHGYLAALSPQ